MGVFNTVFAKLVNFLNITCQENSPNGKVKEQIPLTRQLLKLKFVIPAFLIIVLLLFIFYMQNQGPKSTLSETQLTYQTDWEYLHPLKYAGVVWIKIIPKAENLKKIHTYEIKWGALRYTGRLNFNGYDSAFLKHNKADYKSTIHITLSIHPPCNVVFGQGSPRGENIIDINRGWEKNQ
jgi:hypothetical protein